MTARVPNTEHKTQRYLPGKDTIHRVAINGDGPVTRGMPCHADA